MTRNKENAFYWLNKRGTENLKDYYVTLQSSSQQLLIHVAAVVASRNLIPKDEFLIQTQISLVRAQAT